MPMLEVCFAAALPEGVVIVIDPVVFVVLLLGAALRTALAVSGR